MRKTSVFVSVFFYYLPTLFGQIPMNGLVAYWPFNGNVADEGPNHLPTLPHKVIWTEDRFGKVDQAIFLNGDTAYVEVPDAPALHVYNFTYSFWLLADEWISNDAFFLAKRLDKPANRFSIAVYPRWCTMNTFICNDVGDECYQRSSLWVPKLHIWHCITVTGNHAEAGYSMYLDGELAGRVDFNMPAAYDHNPLTFGVWAFHGAFGSFFRGKLDDIRIYDRALTPQEVYQLAANRPEGKGIGTGWMKRELPDGKYVAYLTEKNKIVSAAPVLFALKRRQPFWQTVWFLGIGLCLVSLFALLIQRSWSVQRIQSRQLDLDRMKAIEQERSRIARDLHDDLGSGLSAIGLLTEIARQKSQNADLDAEIEQMATTSGELSRKIREIIWMVSARFDRLENLVSYLNHFAVELFADSDTELEVQLPLDIPAAILNGEQRRTFFQVVKTALLSIHRATPVRLRLEFSRNSPFALTLSYPGPDIFTGEIEPTTAFGQMLQKLRETGSEFVLQTGETITLRFLLHIDIG